MSHAALLIPGLDRIGGAERQLMLLAFGLRKRGWWVSVVALSGTGGTAATELRAAGATFTSLGMRKGLADPRGWIRFHRWLGHERPDVVHAHLPHAAFMARWSRLGAPSPAPVFLDTLHSASTGTSIRHLGYRLSGWLPDRVTAVSSATAEAHLAAGLADPNKLVVLPNGVDVETLRPDEIARAAARRVLGIKDEFLWLAAGRLEPVKDYPTLLRALALLPEEPRLMIAGSGPLQSDLCRLVAELGIEDRVRFLGFQAEVGPWMQAADAFVLSSRWEGLPMGLLEAGACGLPSVATDVPGSREVIVQGQTGWLAAAGDCEALATKMHATMFASPEARSAMGERARRHVAARFSIETVLNQWEQLYAELLGAADRSVQPVGDAVSA